MLNHFHNIMIEWRLVDSTVVSLGSVLMYKCTILYLKQKYWFSFHFSRGFCIIYYYLLYSFSSIFIQLSSLYAYIIFNNKQNKYVWDFLMMSVCNRIFYITMRILSFCGCLLFWYFMGYLIWKKENRDWIKGE